MKRILQAYLEDYLELQAEIVMLEQGTPDKRNNSSMVKRKKSQLKKKVQEIQERFEL